MSESSRQYIIQMPSPDNIIPIHEFRALHGQDILTSNNHDSLVNSVRSTWSPIVDVANLENSSSVNNFVYTVGKQVPFMRIKFDRRERRFIFTEPSEPENPLDFETFEDNYPLIPITEIYKVFSTADLVYRIRALFPSAVIASEGPDGYKVVVTLGLFHSLSGFSVLFSEWKGGALVRVNVPRDLELYMKRAKKGDNSRVTEWQQLEQFSIDLYSLFTFLVDTTIMMLDNNKAIERLTFFHPSAVALCVPDVTTTTSSFSTSYVVNPPYCGDRLGDNAQARAVIMEWTPIKHDPAVAPTDLVEFSDSFLYSKSQRLFVPLPQDDVNEFIPLAKTISSSLLFYRLLCLFQFNDAPCVLAPGDENQITGVWSVFLRNKTSGQVIEIKDLYGLATAWVPKSRDEDTMLGVTRLLTLACSDVCPHPYDNTVAGCVA